MKDKKGGKIIAAFNQIPLILGYGITVHKTQGMTLDEIVLNGGFFETGHAYVAFSRVKTMKGVYISTDIPYYQLKTDLTVLEFYQKNNLI